MLRINADYSSVVNLDNLILVKTMIFTVNPNWQIWLDHSLFGWSTNPVFTPLKYCNLKIQRYLLSFSKANGQHLLHVIFMSRSIESIAEFLKIAIYIQ